MKIVPDVHQHGPAPAAFRPGAATRWASRSAAPSAAGTTTPEVAVMGTGGLSHQLDGTRAGFINKDFDLPLHGQAWLTTRNGATQFSTHELVEKAGTQGVELLMWLATRGALGSSARCVRTELPPADLQHGLGPDASGALKHHRRVRQFVAVGLALGAAGSARTSSADTSSSACGQPVLEPAPRERPRPCAAPSPPIARAPTRASMPRSATISIAWSASSR